jgi:uncharacterized membrane protein YadS
MATANTSMNLDKELMRVLGSISKVFITCAMTALVTL